MPTLNLPYTNPFRPSKGTPVFYRGALTESKEPPSRSRPAPAQLDVVFPHVVIVNHINIPIPKHPDVTSVVFTKLAGPQKDVRELLLGSV